MHVAQRLSKPSSKNLLEPASEPKALQGDTPRPKPYQKPVFRELHTIHTPETPCPQKKPIQVVLICDLHHKSALNQSRGAAGPRKGLQQLKQRRLQQIGLQWWPQGP